MISSPKTFEMLARLIFVDDQNEGFRLRRALRLLAVQVALERRDVELAVKEQVDRLLHEASRVNLADGHAFAVYPVPAYGTPMGIASLWPWVEFIVASEFADRPKQRIALRHDHDVALAHPVAEDERHLDRSGPGIDVGVSLGFAGLDDRYPIGILVISPIDVFESEERVTACDGLFEEMRIFWVVRLAERHLEHLPACDGDRVTVGRPAPARLRHVSRCAERCRERFPTGSQRRRGRRLRPIRSSAVGLPRNPRRTSIGER